MLQYVQLEVWPFQLPCNGTLEYMESVMVVVLAQIEMGFPDLELSHGQSSGYIVSWSGEKIIDI